VSRAPFRLPAGRRQAAADVAREIRFHLEMTEAELRAAGLPAEQARAEARRRFGDPDAVAAECLTEEGARQDAVRRREWLAGWRQDLGYALRTLRRAPGFTVAAALTLGLALGATVAMFSVVDAVLLRALPLPDAARVVSLVPTVRGEARSGSPGLLAAWGERARSLHAIAAATDRQATVLLADGAARVQGLGVSAGFAAVAGVTPALGRTLARDDDRPGAPPVVLLGERLWRRALGGAPDAVGRTLSLDGVPHTVVGVLPARFDAVLGEREFVVPLRLAPAQRANFTPYLPLVARLRPGVTPDAAARELDAITAALPEDAADDGARPRAQVLPLARATTDAYRRPLLLMLAAVGAVLLIGCANVATLVLARSVGRARELAVRASLGAGRGRLVRQLAVEHLVLGALAVVVALPVAAAGVRALAAAVPADVPRLADAALDGRALLVAVALGLLTSLLCGVAPALHQRRLDVRAGLAGGRGTTDRRGDRWRRALVAAEVALALVLLTGAGLLVRSAVALGRVRPGIDVAHVLTARLALPPRDYPAAPAALDAYARVVDAARREPGVERAALASRVPLGGALTGVDVAPAGAAFDGAKVNAALRVATPDYFRTIGIPLLAGRDLRAEDDVRAARVVVVNATLARQLGGAASAVGRRIVSDNGAFADSAGAPLPLEVVGVVGDVRDGGPRAEPGPEFYVPLAQVPEEPFEYWIGRELVLVARTPGEPSALAPALRRAVAAVDARVPLYDVQTTAARLGSAVAVERFSLQLLSLLGAAGLALAALGIHGVVAYAVGRRARELGIRLALGATARGAVALLVRQGMRPVAAGLVLGLAASVVAARAASSLLFGVEPLDPLSLAGAVAVMGGVAALACWNPARRAARVDPVVALRQEG
jgi:predicted permease